MATLAPCLRNLFNEIDANWPNRSHRLDGWIGDAAHQARDSDHNPDSRGIVHAIDIDKNWIDTDFVVEQCIAENRPTQYVIWNRTIWSRTRDFRPRPYTGDNPHTDHIHVSIQYGTYWESADWHWSIAPALTGFIGGAVAGASDDMDQWGLLFDAAANSFNDNGLSANGLADMLDFIMR